MSSPDQPKTSAERLRGRMDLLGELERVLASGARDVVAARPPATPGDAAGMAAYLARSNLVLSRELTRIAAWAQSAKDELVTELALLESDRSQPG